MTQAASTSCPGLNIQTQKKKPTQQVNSHIKAESQACCGCMPPDYGCMPPDNAPEIEVLQSCYQSSLVLAVNDRESTIHLGVKELGSNGLTFPQEMGWSGVIIFKKLLLPCSCKRWTSLPSTHITIFEPTNSQTVPSTDLIQLQHQTSCRGSPGG